MASNDRPQSDAPGLLTTKDDVSTATTAGASPQESQPQPLPIGAPAAGVAAEPVEQANSTTQADQSVLASSVANPAETQPPTGADATTSPIEAKPDGTSAPATTDPESVDAGELKAEALAPQPSSQSDASAKEAEEDSGPSLVITLLLITGSRHPFKIDGKYLRKRSVNVENDDPFAMSVYTLKELIWREWRQGRFRHASWNAHPIPLTLMSG